MRPVTGTLRDRFDLMPPSDTPRGGRADRAASGISHGVASDRVYSEPMLPWVRVSSYLAFPSLPSDPKREEDGGISLLHFPGGYPRLTLSVTLPCDARTFLMIRPFGIIPRGRPAKQKYYNTKTGNCQEWNVWTREKAKFVIRKAGENSKKLQIVLTKG